MKHFLRGRNSRRLDLFLFGLFAVPITTGLMLEISIEYFFSGIELPAAFLLRGLILIILGGSQSEPGPTLTLSLGGGMVILSVVGMCVALAVAIVRHRLYDIDIILARYRVED